MSNAYQQVYSNVNLNDARDKDICKLFEYNVMANPENTAVVCGEKELTYKKLNINSNKLARFLVLNGITKDKIVGIYSDRNINFLTSILATFKAGGAYLPINPSFPDKRILYMLKKSETNLILVSKEMFDKVSDITRTISEENRPTIAVIDEIIKSDFSEDNLDINYSPKDLAYVIFTSGSTGKPKGVMLQRGGMVNHLISKISDMDIKEEDKVAQIASQCFDISVWQFLCALLVGGQVHIFENDIVKSPQLLLEKADMENISIMQVVPSMLRSITQYVESQKSLNYKLKSLRWLALVGEALPPFVCKKWFEFYPYIPLLNSYGPTECSDGVTHHLIYEAPDDSVINMPIGKPIANLNVYILETANSFNIIESGKIGELCVSGIGVARGYINDEEKTNKAFIKNPFSDDSEHSILYRTGDLVKYLPNGDLEYLGRIDSQVKIRGFRIELGEIESHILKYEGIKACAIVAKKRKLKQEKIVARECLVYENTNDDVTYLAAYIVSDHKIKDFKLKNYLKEYLPDYMIPDIIVRLSNLPLNINGKLDVKALPEPNFVRPDLDKPYVCARNNCEEIVANVWKNILNINAVGIYDTFLELGGDSLLAMRTLNKLEELTNVKLSFSTIFTCSVQEIAKIIMDNQNKKDSNLEYKKNEPKNGLYPLSLEQQRLWFLWKLEGENPFYMLQGSVSINGNVNVNLLKKAWLYVIKSHDGLRANFVEKDGKPYQKFIEINDISFEVTDLVEMNQIKQEEYIKNEALREVQIPFKLDKDLLFRIKAFKISEKEYKILFTTHEIIMDAWSLSTVMRQLKKYYSDLYVGNDVNYKQNYNLRDYVMWESSNITPDSLDIQSKYWKKKLSGKLPLLDIATDKKRLDKPTYKGKSEGILLDIETSKKLKELNRNNNSTLFMTLLAAFDVLLYNYTGQEDIIVGSPNVNRNVAGTEELVGFFLNMLPFRVGISSSVTFLEVLNSVKKTVIDGFSNSNYPFLWMVESADTIRDANISPVFQVMFNMYSEKEEFLQNENEDSDVIDVSFRELDTGFTKYELTLYAQEHGERIYLQFSYFKDLFGEEFIKRMLKNFEVLIKNILKNPNVKISDIQYLDLKEKEMLISTLNNTNKRYSYDLSIIELFENRVKESPQEIAYIYDNNTITYEDLNIRSNKLANYLKRNGVKKGMYISICLEKSFDMIIGILATMKLGCAYIPLDPEYPLSRLESIIKDTNTKYMITQTSVDNVESFNGKKIIIDKEKTFIDEENYNNINCEIKKDDILNIIYTSSSTGKPKGVNVSIKSVLNRLNWMWEEYPFRFDDVAVFHKSYALIAATWECFGALLKGIPTLLLTKQDVLDPTILWRKLTENKVSYFLSNPALIQSILEQGKLHSGDWNSLRIATTSAEAIPVNMVLQWHETFPNALLLNLYGSTECSSNAVVYDTKFINNNDTKVPIGKPLSNTKIFIINENNKLVPYGTIGEMCVCGDCVSSGYLNLDKLNKEKFIINPYLENENKILYKTGDLARYMDDGNIELVGRKDNQVKIRGFRVELGDIELTLQKHEDINKCAAKIFEDKEGRKRLVAYIEGEKIISSSQLRSFLIKYLPDYMIPSDYVFLNKIPLTVTGKIDRKILKEPKNTNLNLDNKFVPANTSIEKFLVKVWAELLRRENIGIEDNFFDLGGHSLLVMQTISKIYNKFNVEIPVRKIFENPTIVSLAKEVELLVNSNTNIQIKSFENKKINFVSGIASLTLPQKWYFNLRDTLVEPNRYNISRMFEVKSDFDKDKLKKALKHLWHLHDSLRARFVERNGEWEQIIDNPNKEIPYKEFDFENISKDEEKDVIEKYAEELQGSFDISNGPLMCVAYFNFGKSRSGRLLMIFHHLIVDGYSITIFIKDLYSVYSDLVEEKQINLPQEGTTIKQWGELFNEYVFSKSQSKEIDYWLSLPWRKIRSLPLDYPQNKDKVIMSSLRQITIDLTVEETNILIRQIPLKYDISTINVLIWALTKVVSKWTNGDWVQIDMVGNGRDIMPDKKYLEMSNTIGFFAFIRNLVLENINSNDLLDELKNIDNQINNIPNNGYGYEILNAFKYNGKFAEHFDIDWKNEIMFNYKGAFNEINDVKLAKEFKGFEFSPKNPILTSNRIMLIDGAIIDNHLSITWNYSENVHKKDVIEKVANENLNILRAIVKRLK